MLKSEAIELLGKTVTAAAREIGITPQAVGQWPEELPPSIRDRVQAALWQRFHPQGDPSGESDANAAASAEGAPADQPAEHVD